MELGVSDTSEWREGAKEKVALSMNSGRWRAVDWFNGDCSYRVAALIINVWNDNVGWQVLAAEDSVGTLSYKRLHIRFIVNVIVNMHMT
jgi:hypothetical protein